MRLLRSCVLALLSTAAAAPVAAQSAKMGWVDTNVILRELPMAQDAQKTLEASLQGYTAEMQQLISDLQTLEQEYRHVAVGETDGFVKMIFDSDTKELLGSHIIGRGATEMIAELGIAKTLETTPLEIATTQHAHPTLSEAVMEAALDALGRVRNI